MVLKKPIEFSGQRVLAFGITDINLPLWLESQNIKEYEVNFRDENLLSAAKAIKLSGKIGVYTNIEQIKYAHGDILFAEGDALKFLGKYSLFKKYEQLYVYPNSLAQIVYLICYFMRYFVSGRRISINIPLFLKIHERRWLNMAVRRITTKKNRSLGRIFLPEGWEYKDLFKKLNQDNIDYVVLRWWERLPNMPSNNDVDILTSDECRDYFFNFMRNNKSGNRALDVYTVSGIEHSAQDITYYEPEKAREILGNTIDGPCSCKIPSPYNAFMALAYHALYHKGFYAGLTSVYRKKENGGKFYDFLQKNVEILNISTALDMESLDAYLAIEGWRPPMDKLARIAMRNEWVKVHFFDNSPPQYDAKYIGAFVLRKECEEYGASEFILDLIKKYGFEIVAVRSIVNEKKFSEKMRGGNWKDGKLPSVLVVVYDNNPQWVNAKKRTTNEFVDNSKMRCKLEIRDILNKKYRTRKNSWLHGCDNLRESAEYIKEVVPDLMESIYNQ